MASLVIIPRGVRSGLLSSVQAVVGGAQGSGLHARWSSISTASSPSTSTRGSDRRAFASTSRSCVDGSSNLRWIARDATIISPISPRMARPTVYNKSSSIARKIINKRWATTAASPSTSSPTEQHTAASLISAGERKSDFEKGASKEGVAAVVKKVGLGGEKIQLSEVRRLAILAKPERKTIATAIGLVSLCCYVRIGQGSSLLHGVLEVYIR